MGDLESKEAVKLFVFDFDLTISNIHVFKSLAGWDRPNVVKPPFASTEVGQIKRIADFNSSEEFKDSFATMAMGGDKRAAALRQLFTELNDAGATILICTKGLVGTCNSILKDLDFASFFSNVYGRIGTNYGMTEYDKAAMQEIGRMESRDELKALLGKKEQDAWLTKEALCRELMGQQGLEWEQAILIEDDPNETKAAAETCRTMLVDNTSGMKQDDMIALVNLARGLGRSTTDNRDVIDAFQPIPRTAWGGQGCWRASDGAAGSLALWTKCVHRFCIS